MSSYSVLLYRAPDLPEAYLPIIYSRWLRSLRKGNDYFRLVQTKAYYTAYHRYVQNVLKHPDTEIRLAALTDDRDVILGFSVSRGTVLEYVHVDKDQRLQGIARSLVPKQIDTITHLTRTGLSIWGSKTTWKFNPFA